MATLAKDLGRKVEIQLHVDALAAKGMIERKGLSKVRHLDVNVLWLQEQCARKILPVHKVPGEENPADLMTKHLGAAKVQGNIARMGMRFQSGRAGKAAQLHQLSKTQENDISGVQLWEAMQDKFIDQKGGDHWKSRGEGGVWQRVHSKPRKALFTPFKVAKGPEKSESLNIKRFTKGVTQSGRKFEFHDEWQRSENAHRLLEEKWIGCTTFVVKGRANLHDLQRDRLRGSELAEVQGKKSSPGLRWSDILS